MAGTMPTHARRVTWSCHISPPFRFSKPQRIFHTPSTLLALQGIHSSNMSRMIRSAPDRLLDDATLPTWHLPKPSREFQHTDMLEEIRNPGYAIPEIGMSAFVTHLLPPLRDGISVEAVMASLVTKGVVSCEQDWMVRRSTRSRGLKDNHSVLLFSFQKLYNTAVSLAAQDARNLEQIISMDLPLRPRRTLRQNVTLQRVYFILKEPGSHTNGKKARRNRAYSLSNIALAVEVKTDDTPESREEASAEKTPARLYLKPPRRTPEMSSAISSK